jgi:hypothetical protein
MADLLFCNGTGLRVGAKRFRSKAQMVVEGGGNVGKRANLGRDSAYKNTGNE